MQIPRTSINLHNFYRFVIPLLKILFLNMNATTSTLLFNLDDDNCYSSTLFQRFKFRG